MGEKQDTPLSTARQPAAPAELLAMLDGNPATPGELDAPPKTGPVIAALGQSSTDEDVIQSASALARETGVPFHCVIIDNGIVSSAEEGERMARALRLARKLGARIASEPGIDTAAGLLDYASLHGASALIVGMGRSRFLGRRVADRLLSARRSFSVVTVSPHSGVRNARASLSFGPAGHYVAAFLLVVAVTGLDLLLAGYAGYWAAAIPYLAAISLAALALDRWPVLFAALLSAVAWDFFFIPPRFTLFISRTEDILMLGLYILVALCSGWMTGMLRANERLLAARENRMSRLSALAHTLAGAKTIDAILGASVEAIGEAFAAETIVILREKNGGLKNQSESGWEPMDAGTRDAARVSFEEMKSSGRFTNSHPDSEWHFVPMDGPKGCLGVLGLRLAGGAAWNEDLESFLRTIALTVSIAAARELLEPDSGYAASENSDPGSPKDAGLV
jgi:two-component system sensor histidine kinase KdpD